MRICVAGADCFIGVSLIKRLLKTNNDIVAVVRDSTSKTVFGSDNNLEIIQLDFANYESMGNIVGKVDCFMILTWIGTRGQLRMDESLQQENYIKVKSAVLSMIDQGCKRILTAGSQAEYGLFSGLISESTSCNPNTEYGKYKLKLFEDLSEICVKKGISYKEPRFFSLYGPGDFSGTLIMSSIEKMQRNEECNFTESIQMWDYLFIEDAVEAVARLCIENCADGPYIFGSGDRRQLKEYIIELKEILKSDSKLVFGAVPYGPAGIVTIEPDNSKLKNELKWGPRFSFRDGINEIIKSLKMEY